MDPLFIFVFKWGIAGADWATGIGQLLSFVMCAVYFRKPKCFRLTQKSFAPDLSVLRSTVMLARGYVYHADFNCCDVAYGQYCSGKVRRHVCIRTDIPISVFSIQTKVYTVVLSVVTGVVLGGQQIFSNNYAAGKLSRVRETYTLVLICTLIVSLAATVLFRLKPEWIIGIFGEGNEYYMDFAKETFRIHLSLMTVTCLTKMTAVFFQSIGKSVRAFVASLIRDILCFTPIAIFLPAIMEKAEAGSGVNGILFAAPAADIVALCVIAFLTIPFYRSLKDHDAQEAASDPVIRPSKPGVIITIASEHGSEGKQIGKLVAEKMGIPFYYEEMTALAAMEAWLDRQFVSGINENSPNHLHELYLSTKVIQQAVNAQETIISRIADNGSCVIVGRSADRVLRNRKDVVRVFIHAPKVFRIASIMERYVDSPEEAAANIRHSDEARAAYYRSISGQNWGDMHLYELCVNACAGREKCAETIIRFVSEKG